MEELADEAKKAAAKGDLNTVYKITKQLSGQSSPTSNQSKMRKEKL